MEIVPLDDTLLIEAKIRPADIGFIHPGQKAMVKITAYDFSIYGGLDGVVEQISADAIVDEEKNRKGEEESYYIVKVRTDKNHLGTEKKPLPIIPGMQATVDILTGQKTVLQYILKPIIKAKQSALRER
ncbi:HlyD family efflux transporter periplasmic adaptor subunit [Legionella norrlandica]|uniref:HlyD family efflux transporter periplasmic adaptor subunit n=1 Tax=Legionella norrlandica TaxID=1498499 RepID=UPI000A6A504E|nr:HlyD family efflux transporter periplasmic adaptor subunit [Legionella norrlandica]